MPQVVNYDIDNIMKAIFDNLQRAGLIADDKLIIASTIIKTLADEDRTHVRIYKGLFSSEGLPDEST